MCRRTCSSSQLTPPSIQLRRSQEILEKFLPWEAEGCREIELTDPMGILVGRFPPTVRKPVCKLPSESSPREWRTSLS